MITAIHALLYSRDATAARLFFRDVMKLESVDAGDGWLIFALPPAELAVHPSDTPHGAELYLMCDDVERTVAELEQHGVRMTRPVTDQGWGLVTTIRIPGGLELGLYQPRHKTAVSLRGKRPGAKGRTGKKSKRVARRRTQRRG